VSIVETETTPEERERRRQAAEEAQNQQNEIERLLEAAMAADPQAQQNEIERLIEAERVANPRLLTHQYRQPISDSPMTGMPTTLGSVYGTKDGVVAWPVQPTAEAIVAPDEPQVFVDVPPDAVFGWNEARLLAEGWMPPLDGIRGVILAREALWVAVKATAARRRSGIGLIDRAARGGDAEATAEAIVGLALDAWHLAADLNDAASDMSAVSKHLANELALLLWRHQRAVLRSLVGRNSSACQILRAKVEAMVGSPAPRADVSFREYILMR
jgi:hypothetical protein